MQAIRRKHDEIFTDSRSNRVSHTSELVDTGDELGTRIITIPDGFTSVCQPCDFGIMKSLKTRFTKLCQDWKVAEYARLVEPENFLHQVGLKFYSGLTLFRNVWHRTLFRILLESAVSLKIKTLILMLCYI